MKNALHKIGWPVGTCAFYLVLVACLYVSLRAELQANRDETLVNRTYGQQLRKESADVQAKLDAAARVSRENNALLREALPLLRAAARPANP